MNDYVVPTMTVAELRELLSRVPQDLTVFIGYDSMVVVEQLQSENIFAIEKGDDSGVYLCAESATVTYVISEDSESDYFGGKRLNQYSIPVANP